MSISKGRIALLSIAALTAFGLLSVLAPFVNAGQHRDRLAVALQQSLGRKVELGAIRYRLLPAPGLLARNVVIQEAPEFGLDALAYVDELAVDLSWLSLIQGKVVISTVRMTDASINLARNDSGEWAFNRILLKRGAWPGRIPRLLVSNGRINFSTGTLKSPIYLNAVELDLGADHRSQGGIEWQYEASPARTDRSEQGFGRFIGSGRWSSNQGENGFADVEILLERSATSEVSMLLAGRDLGLQGRVLSRARLFGPPRDITVSGSIEFEGLERSGLLSFRGTRLSVPYEGTLDLPRQVLRLATQSPEDERIPLSADLLVSNFLGNVSRETRFRFDKMPAKTLWEIGRRLGQTLPGGLVAAGAISGQITVAGASVAGDIEIEEPRVQFEDGSELQAPAAKVTIQNDEILLAPAEVVTAGGAAEIRGRYSTADGSLELQAMVRELPAASLRAAMSRIPGSRRAPFLGDLTQGRLTGSIRFNGADVAGPWAAELELSGGRVEPSGLSLPVDFRKAEIRVRGEQWTLRRIQGLANGIGFSGEYSHSPGARRTDRFMLAGGDVDASALEDLFRPALGRGRGILERALRLTGRTPSGGLRARRAEGILALRSLQLGPHRIEAVKTHMFWDGDSIECPDVAARWEDAPFRGNLAITLRRADPAYRIRGQVENLAWQAGHVDLDLDAQATGFGDDLLGALAVQGDFQARNLLLEGDAVRFASGTLDFQASRTAPLVRLRSVEVQTGGDVFTGYGAIQPDGQITLDLSNARRPLRLAFDLSGRKAP